MKILVSGSEGNIGRKLVPYLRKCGHQVVRLDIKNHFAKDYILHDVRDFLDGFSGKLPDVVYHMAGMVSRITCEKSSALALITNIMGTYNIINFCKWSHAKLINFSTSEVYGNIGGILKEDNAKEKPNNVYGISKLQAERLMEYETDSNNIKGCTVRPFMFYDEYETRGVHRSAMIRFAEALCNKKPITVHTHSKRSWLHMDDAVVALEKCMHLNEYETINIGHPKVYSMLKIALIMCEELGLNPTLYINEEDLPERMTLIKEPDLSKQKELLGFEPTISIEEGIKRVIAKCRG